MSILQKILPKKETVSYFLTLGVEEHHIFAAAVKISGNKITIIGTGESEFRDKENEIEAADIAVSTAEKTADKNLLIDKVVFGIPIAFLKDDKIKPDFIERLKKISRSLDLKPAGFVEYPQALACYLRMKEETPPTVILLAIGQAYLTFSLLRVGKIEFSTTVERDANFLADFEKILGSFSSEVLPSKIILYDENRNSQLEQLREELLTFPWQKHPAFLHTPKIEIVPKNFIISALVEAAAGSLMKEWQIEENAQPEEKKAVSDKEAVEEKEDTFGFTRDEESVGEEAPLPEDTQPATRTVPEKNGDNFVLQAKKRLSSFSMPSISLPAFSLNKNIFSVIGLLFFAFIIFAGVYLLYWSYPTATVKLIVYPITRSSQADFIFTTDSTRLSSGKNVILANQISEEASSQKTATVSGKSKVGEAAGGEITIYNKTVTAKTFPKGTVLETSGLQYQLEDEVRIASSSDTGEGLVFGKTTGKIKASAIGPEGNLAANNNFTFKDSAPGSFYAKNTDKISGGTSREISSVSKDDQDKLLADLTAQLETDAKQKIIQKLSPGIKLLDNSFQKNIISKKFSREIGSEAREFSLSLTVKIAGLTFKEDDLSALTKELLTLNQTGFIRDQERNQLTVREMQVEKNGDIKAKVTLSAYFLPEIDEKNIISNLAGKSYSRAADYLAAQNNLGGIEIIAENSLPFLENKLPGKMENINLQIIPR